MKLFTIADAFGGWQAASKTHFAGGAIFDQIYQPAQVESERRLTIHVTRRSSLPGFRITMAFTVVYLAVIVLVPLLTLPVKSFSEGWESFWTTVSDPRVIASYRLTIGASFVAA